jgi:hypothetical protein
MRHDLETALDQSLDHLRGGMDIESCLQLYPEYSEDLRPLLELVTQVGRVITPASSAAAREAGQELVLATAARKRAGEAAGVPLFGAIRRTVRSLVPAMPGSPAVAWRFAATVLLIVLVAAAGGVSVRASGSSLPGDLLYPLKLAVQRTQLALTFDAARQHGLEVRFEDQQRMDVQAALKGGRQTDIEFQGVLQSMVGDTWVVGGLPVTLQNSTELVGQPRLGASVLVRGSLPGNGELLATWLQVEPGLAEEPSQTPTATEPVPPSETPEPSDTPLPTDTSLPTNTTTPTETLVPSSTPEATETESPGKTPEQDEIGDSEGGSEPDNTPGAEGTPGPGDGDLDPTEVPEPDDTPQSGGRPDPTEVPEPEDTPQSGGRPDPTKTPKPEDTREPGDEPDPTEAPEPEETPEHGEGPEPTHGPESDGTPGDEGGADESDDSLTEPQPDETPDHGERARPTEEPHD